MPAAGGGRKSVHTSNLKAWIEGSISYEGRKTEWQIRDL